MELGSTCTDGSTSLLHLPAPAVQCIGDHLTRRDKQALAASSAQTAAWLMHGCSRVCLQLTACPPHRRQQALSWAAQHAGRLHVRLGTKPAADEHVGQLDALELLCTALPTGGQPLSSVTSMKLQNVQVTAEVLQLLSRRCPNLTHLKLRHCRFQQASLDQLLLHLQPPQQGPQMGPVASQGPMQPAYNTRIEAIVVSGKNSRAAPGQPAAPGTPAACPDAVEASHSINQAEQRRMAAPQLSEANSTASLKSDTMPTCLLPKLHHLDVAYGPYTDSWQQVIAVLHSVTRLTLGPFLSPQRVPVQALDVMPSSITHLTLAIGCFTYDQQAQVQAFYERLSRLSQLCSLDLIYAGPTLHSDIPLPPLLHHLSLPPVPLNQLSNILQHPHLTSLETGISFRSSDTGEVMSLIMGCATYELMSSKCGSNPGATNVRMLKLTKGSTSIAALASLPLQQLQQPLIIQGQIMLQPLGQAVVQHSQAPNSLQYSTTSTTPASSSQPSQLLTSLGQLQDKLVCCGGFETVRDLQLLGRCGLPMDERAVQQLEVPEYVHHVTRYTENDENNSGNDEEDDASDTEIEPEGLQEGEQVGAQVLQALLPHVRSIGGNLYLSRMVIGQEVLQALCRLRSTYKAPLIWNHPRTLLLDSCVLRHGFWQFLKQLFLGDSWGLPGPSSELWHVEIQGPLNAESVCSVPKIASFCQEWQQSGTNPHARKLQLTCSLRGCVRTESAQSFLSRLSSKLQAECGLQPDQLHVIARPFDSITICLGSTSRHAI